MFVQQINRAKLSIVTEDKIISDHIMTSHCTFLFAVSTYKVQIVFKNFLAKFKNFPSTFFNSYSFKKFSAIQELSMTSTNPGYAVSTIRVSLWSVCQAPSSKPISFC